MITVAPGGWARSPLARAASTTTLLCITLVGCSSSSTPTAMHADTQPSATARSSRASAHPSSPTSSISAAIARSSPSKAKTASDTTACALVSEHEAAIALGADPGAGQPNAHLGASSCIYGASPTLVSVNLMPTGGAAAYDHARRQASPGGLISLPAVGDGAFGVFRGPAAEIWFHEADAMAAVGVILDGAPTPPKHQALVLAKLAAGRL